MVMDYRTKLQSIFGFNLVKVSGTKTETIDQTQTQNNIHLASNTYFEIICWMITLFYSETNEQYYHRCHSLCLARYADSIPQLCVQTRYYGSPIVAAASGRRRLQSQMTNGSKLRLQPQSRVEVADLKTGKLPSWQQTLKVNRNSFIWSCENIFHPTPCRQITKHWPKQ